MKILPTVLFGFVLAYSVASAAVLTNDDVIKMAGAKLDDAIIVTAVENAEPKFDVSPQGLIALSAAKVSGAVISAMIKRSNAPAESAAGKATAAATETMAPSEVLFIDGDKTTVMRYLNPQMRTSARALGFGGVATYAVLRGTSAEFRTGNAQPSFLVSVPDQAQPESYLTLASFAVRPNGSREVMVGGGYMSYSTGVHPDRVVKVRSEKAADQTKAQKGFTIYKITPASPLALGQYAVILYTGEMQGVVGSWFTGTGNAYFDFAIESSRS